MALNPQPYLSDSTDEFLIDALPAVAQGLAPWEVVMLSFASADPAAGDDCERILGFLQIWVAQPELIKDYWIPMLTDTARAIREESGSDEEYQAVLDQIQGMVIMTTAQPDFGMADIGYQLSQIAIGNLDRVGEVYGEWFADQRREALEDLRNTFSTMLKVGATP